MTSIGIPTLTPPGAQDAGTAIVGTSAPSLSNGGSATAVLTPPPQAPTLGLAAEGSAQAAQAITTGTWRNGVTVDALWSINEVRNAWMRVVGIGWRRLFNGSDGAFTALTTLASQARQTGRPINFREEADGMAHEIYLL